MRERGLSIVTAGNVVYWPGAYTRLLLEQAGLGSLIDAQVYADEVSCSKPRACIFERASEDLAEEGLDNHIVAHVGVSLREDFLGAISYGLKAVLVDRERLFKTAPSELIPGEAM